MHSQAITALLKEKGPQTGAELLEITGMEPLPLWQACKQTPEISFQRIGKRFVRLDKNVEGYARLSPSIRREFQTYTVLGLEEQTPAIETKARLLQDEIVQISRDKLALAKDAISDTVQSLADRETIQERVCFLIAGDITYDMAHAVPRPEISTGKLVRGSDLDIIAIADDGVPEETLKLLDNAILKKKYFLLVHPNYQEEIDYLVKDMAKVRRQLAFDTFPHMVASKIIYESRLLHGSSAVFKKVKHLVEEFGVPVKLALLEHRAEENRNRAETSLLQSDGSCVDEEFLNLFYTREEGDEIY